MGFHEEPNEKLVKLLRNMKCKILWTEFPDQSFGLVRKSNKWFKRGIVCFVEFVIVHSVVISIDESENNKISL